LPQVQILYWRQIPAQVRVFGGRRPLTEPLPERFQQEIDRVAMREGLAGTDQYLAHWEWSEKQEHEGDPAQLLRETIDSLIASHDAAPSSDATPGS
jgi:hypothetical protein